MPGPVPVPPCPRCHRTDHAEEEEQTGSSTKWYLCRWCGMRYTGATPPRP